MPESGGRQVEGHRYVAGVLIVEHIPEVAGKTTDGRDVQAFGIDQGSGDKGIMGAIDQGMTVEQKEFFFGHNAGN